MEKGKILFYGSGNGSYSSVEHTLGGEEYTTIEVASLDEIFERARQDRPKAIFIDLDVSGKNGLEVCKKLKKNFDTRKSALILLSSQKNEDDVVKGFEWGADDFVTKPYSHREMTARLNAIIRRIEGTEARKIKVKDIEIDLDEHKVKKSGNPIELTYIQFKLLYLLASQRNSVFSRKEILEKVWGKKINGTARTVDVHIKRLRQKLGEYKYPSQYIKTVHRKGYQFL
ncbi:MAG: response regulator transcription factor [candidate division KSB1 bacterium]|nr:response regulator transcription factor [candidate division KSB1 bacterium]